MGIIILIALGSTTVLMFGYTALRINLLLDPTRDITLFLKETKKQFKEIQKKAAKIDREKFVSNVEEFLKEVEQMRINFSTNKIFMDRELSKNQQRCRADLLERMNNLETRLNYKINRLLEVR